MQGATRNKNQKSSWARNLFNSLGEWAQKIIASWINLWNFILFFMAIFLTLKILMKLFHKDPQPVVQSQAPRTESVTPVQMYNYGDN
jgi:hypothetical protein